MNTQYSHQTLQMQQKSLIEICSLNPILKEILNKTSLPNDLTWYVGGGCVNQTVWNFLTNRPIAYGIDDYDLVFWDDDVSYEAEDKIIKHIYETFSHLDAQVDIKNQARVHLWFPEKFGVNLDPYENIVHAISTWPTTATCVGITKINNDFEVAAPYGLTDLFSMNLRRSHSGVIKEIFDQKVAKWTKKWPELEVIS